MKRAITEDTIIVVKENLIKEEEYNWGLAIESISNGVDRHEKFWENIFAKNGF